MLYIIYTVIVFLANICKYTYTTYQIIRLKIEIEWIGIYF